MKEVSCRILEMFFLELDKKGLPPSKLIDGVGYPLEHFRNKHERIDYSAFVRLMANAEKIWSEDELIAIGGAWIDAPFIRYLKVIAGTLFDARQVYHWFDSRTKGARKGISVQMFTCVTVAVTDEGPRGVRLEVDVDEGYEPCRAFFLLTKGGYIQLPRMVGKGLASVEMTWTARGARYDVTLPKAAERPGIVRRATEAAKRFASPAAVVRELDEAHATLQVRYEELDAARGKLALQAAQLRTAHSVNALVQIDLDLDLTMNAVAYALVSEAGFARAVVEVDANIDDIKVKRSAEYGEGGELRFERHLEGRGGARSRQTGTLVVFARPEADGTDREELLDFVVPSISMAIDNALSYFAVEEYRLGLEKRVTERTAELSEARDALAGTVCDLEAAKEVRDRIFANVNHDLRSPLSLIILSINEARRAGSASTSTKTLDAIEHGARRVLRMVDELLILAEGREGEVRLATALCNLGEMAGVIATAWRPAAESRGLTLTHRLDKGIIVRADPNAIERILANLVSNAVKFTPAGGAIEVSLTSASGRAHLDVSDNGPGIDADLKKRLFGRFERGAGLKTGTVNGSGLGLSLVRELAEAQRGAATVHDAPGGGALFRVDLPIVVEATSATATAGPKLRPSDFGLSGEATQEAKIYEPPAGTTARATVLLAEDDPDLREKTALLLAEEYRVLAAPDGLIALDLATKYSPDLLITDLAMPNLDGIELTRRFRTLPNNRISPVLVLTTFGGVSDKLSGFDAGAVDYIHKPFEPVELRARVRSQLTVRSLALRLLETENLAALGTLSAGLAHEIRNPANGIINAVGPLKELLPPDAIAPGTPAAQLLDIVEHCSKQVAAMSRQLLGFKRGVEPKRQPVGLEMLITRVCTTVSPSLEGIELRRALNYTGTVHCAEPLIAQVLTNLVQNGAHAAGRGGWVEVRTGLATDRGAARVVVEVADSGPGVPEELKERIFEPFFTTKPAGSGTGLGLSTARDIALRHGGSLDVKIASGRTVFRLEIPQPS